MAASADRAASARRVRTHNTMAKQVEVRLRVPNMKVRALDENGYPIDHSSVRFRKVIEVPAIPKAEEPLELTTSSGRVAAGARGQGRLERGQGPVRALLPVRQSVDHARRISGAGGRPRVAAEAPARIAARLQRDYAASARFFVLARW